jgi:hypothetical protein
MYVLCRSKFGSTPTHQAKEGEMPTSSTEALKAANDRLQQENMLLQERNDQLERQLDRISIQFAKALGAIDAVETSVNHYRVVGQWTPTANAADPETF